MMSILLQAKFLITAGFLIIPIAPLLPLGVKTDPGGIMKHVNPGWSRALVSSFIVLISFCVSCATTGARAQTQTGAVLSGIDVLERNGFELLAGKKIGLITNHTGINRAGASDIDILFQTKSHQLIALFSPEHGIRGDADVPVDSSKDEKTGLPIHSLYGKTVKPTKEMLRGIEVLVFDIQDIGTRFYTYIATMAYAMQAAKENGIRFVVLDRVNPIGGQKVEGAVPHEDFCKGLTCIYPIPTRHGMTIGELAGLFNDHFGIGSDLTVVRLEGWQRGMYFDETGLRWLNPSPNMKTLTGAIFYPGLGIAETTDLSVGRGTARPFEMYGAPYFNSRKIIANLANRTIPGIRFEETSFIPTAPYHPYKDQLCHGVQAIITDRQQLDSVYAGLNMIQAFYETHPSRYTAQSGFKVEVGSAEAGELLTRKKLSPAVLMGRWETGLNDFKALRSRFLLYP